MQVPLEIAYHQVSKSEAIDALIREKMDHLEQFCDHITSCAIVVERPHLHERSGNPFRVRLDLHVPPGHEIVAVAGQEHNEMHDELQTVVIDAFDKAERQLKELTERQRGETKKHEDAAPVAVISQLDLATGRGTITDLTGRDIYFDRSNVIGKEFEALAVGMAAVYTEDAAEEEPRAKTVSVLA
ncbi:MAG TPA: HPF/RaiA family ribosome-associated protein [Chthoniobacteraceae bacterium]|jgi:ribosomal subunit interface protein|nr:cold shock protein [Chthoniobacter sp.]HEV7866147.1 HPF/RaiA family ribosome-associated protein [Chthoniobacteraceae bacterium]